jgi:peroxiredoxin
MKLKNQSLAPEFSTADVYGNSINLADYRGHKVLLSFHRYVGCPICNLRVHSFEQLNNDGVKVINVYESKPETMRKYLKDSSFIATFIADRDAQLYKHYGVEKSWFQFVVGLLKGGVLKGIEGIKLYKGGIKGMPIPDGLFSRIPADFVIDEQGIIIEAYYGKHLGDELSIEKIKAHLS